MTAEPLFNRLRTYQKERFPVLAHGVMTAAFTLAASFFATGLSGRTPDLLALLAGFVLAFAQFALLRIADEHKDYAEDLAYRPNRPVSRGLISLEELRLAGAAALVLQLAMIGFVWARTGAWAPGLIWLGVLAWYALMSFEFFVPRFVREAPVLTLVSHMAILPGIAWLAAAPSLAFAHSPVLTADPGGFGLAGLGVFALGSALELARKIRAPLDEQAGVKTYSRLWGRPGALIVLAATAAAAIVALWAAASRFGYGGIALAPALTALLVAYIARVLLRASPPRGAGKNLETATSIFGLVWLAALMTAGWLAASVL